MTHPWHIKALNPAFGDPGFFLLHSYSGQALLFALGDLQRLSAKQILKVSHIFISHGHIDHLIGFDHFLRVTLNHAKQLHLYGPPGIIALIGHKLQGYSWNLTAHNELLITVHEIHEKSIERSNFACHHKFLAEPLTPTPRNSSEICKTPTFSMATVRVDHGLDCHAFALKEPLQVKIHTAKLKHKKWPPGPWLSQVKKHLQNRSPADTNIAIEGRNYPLQEVADTIAEITPGLKIAYVADSGFTPENQQRLLKLIAGADILLCEAAFLDSAESKAAASKHLTAAQAGQLASLAKVTELRLFHFSPRHAHEKEKFYRQAGDHFSGPIA